MIEKEQGVTLRKAGIWTTDVPTSIAREIRNPDALAIWVYLLGQSAGWTIRRQHLMDHFGIGRDRYQAAIRVLKELELYWSFHVKDEKGRVIDNVAVISTLPASQLEAIESPGIQVSRLPGKQPPGIQVSGRPENPATGDSGPLSTESDSLKYGLKDKCPRRFAPPTPSEVSAYAQERGRTIDADRFVDFYASKGWMVGKTPMKDWRASVRNWLREGSTHNGGSKPSDATHWSTQGLVL